jgi:hypothetical protein
MAFEIIGFTLGTTIAGLSVAQSAANINTGTGNTSLTVTLGAASTAGNLLVAFVRQGENQTDTPTITGWTVVGDTTGWGTSRARMLYRENAPSVSSVTVNYSTGGGVTRPSMVVMEISGAATTSPLDSWAQATEGTIVVSTLASGALTTTNANDIIVFGQDVGGDQASWTQPAGFTLPATAQDVRDALAYQVVSATQAGITPAFTWPSAYLAQNIIAAFKRAPAAGVSVLSTTSLLQSAFFHSVAVTVPSIPTGAVIVVVGVDGGEGTAVPTSTNLTYTLRQRTSNGGQTAIFTAVNGGGELTNEVITFGTTSQYYPAVTAMVLLGANSTALSNVGTATGTSNAPSVSVTATAAGSVIIGGVQVFSTTVATPAAGTTFLLDSDTASADHITTLRLTGTTSGAGAVSVGFTDTTSTQWAAAAIEILPA